MPRESNYVTIKPEHMFLSKEHVLHYYFTDILDSPEDNALLVWANKVAATKDSDNAEENGLIIEINIPTATKEFLSGDFGYEENGRYKIEAEHKARLDSFRQQLVDSLALFDKVDYV